MLRRLRRILFSLTWFTPPFSISLILDGIPSSYKIFLSLTVLWNQPHGTFRKRTISDHSDELAFAFDKLQEASGTEDEKQRPLLSLSTRPISQKAFLSSPSLR